MKIFVSLVLAVLSPALCFGQVSDWENVDCSLTPIHGIGAFIDIHANYSGSTGKVRVFAQSDLIEVEEDRNTVLNRIEEPTFTVKPKEFFYAEFLTNGEMEELPSTWEFCNFKYQLYCTNPIFVGDVIIAHRNDPQGESVSFRSLQSGKGFVLEGTNIYTGDDDYHYRIDLIATHDQHTVSGSPSQPVVMFSHSGILAGNAGTISN